MSSHSRVLLAILMLAALPCWAKAPSTKVPWNTLVAVETPSGARLIGTLSGIAERDNEHTFTVPDKVNIPMRITDDIAWSVSSDGVTAFIGEKALGAVKPAADIQKEFTSRAGKAKLSDQAEVQAVVDFGRSWGLTSQVSALLKAAWPKLKAGADPAKLATLIEWGLANGLEESAVAQEAAAAVGDEPAKRNAPAQVWELAAAYQKLGMAKTASAIRVKALASSAGADAQTLTSMLADLDGVAAPAAEVQTCQGRLYRCRLKSASTAAALADLSAWCRQRGMADEARATRDKALGMSDEAAIHEALGDTQDAKTGKWLAPAHPPVGASSSAKRLQAAPEGSALAVEWIRQWQPLLEVTVVGRQMPRRFPTDGPGVDMKLERWQVVNRSPVTVEFTPEGENQASVRLAPGEFYSTTGKKFSDGVRLAAVPTNKAMWAMRIVWLGSVQPIGADGAKGPSLGLSARFASGDKSITAGWVAVFWNPRAPEADKPKEGKDPKPQRELR